MWGFFLAPFCLVVSLSFLVNKHLLVLSDYDGPDVELVVSPVNNAMAPATQLTCLQFPTSDALTRSGELGGHILRGISRILRARAYLDLLGFCTPSPPDYMRVILSTGRVALSLFFASYES
jgi:hypothetical protein